MKRSILRKMIREEIKLLEAFYGDERRKEERLTDRIIYLLKKTRGSRFDQKWARKFTKMILSGYYSGGIKRALKYYNKFGSSDVLEDEDPNFKSKLINILKYGK